ncbi:PhoX domain-containing protein [Rhodotorula toruloides ATCC 204091]|uniref:PhoX domain-containing protein n=1 Tax=Rhodotorula toruloides TaxID=5286 RepID=A0A0K3CMM6_RHOTO|nr:PhoX domain-containing protein [Rhodotorula toruloides ATCC 204091]KAK4331734.1 Structural protein MDM1 [Rhodotorula toruloides]PRQ73081.1 PhoX domain-containing protein [Rhodotorula toruloides]
MPPQLSYRGAGALVVLAFLLGSKARGHNPLVSLGWLLLYAVAGVVAVLGGQLWLAKVLERRSSSFGSQDGSGEGSLLSLRPGRRRGPPQLHFTSPAAWDMTQTKAKWEATAAANRLSFPGAPPFLSAAIDSLLHLILRDFVEKWYSAFSDSPVFPNAVDATIRESLLAISSRVGKVDWSDVLVGRILPLLTTHFERFDIAEKAVHGRGARAGTPDSDEFDLFVASRYAQESKENRLHPAVDVASPNSRPAEEAWLRSTFETILPLVLPESEGDSPAVRIMVREIVACAVVFPIIEMLSDPDFANRLIDDKAGAAIRDQKMVNEFREALNKQEAALMAAPTRTLSSAASSLPKRRTEVVTVRTGSRQFDAWLKSIGRCASLQEARRLKSDVSGQIRRAKILTHGKELDDVVDGVKVAEWIDFIERLYTAKRKIDKRIDKLGGNQGLARAPSILGNLSSQLDSPVKLSDMLVDPTAVTYVMEFLERRRHADRAQFWLIVEGLKDPLDGIESDESLATDSTFDAVAAISAFEDIRMIWSAYLVGNPFRSSEGHLRAVQAFVEQEDPRNATPQMLRQVRHALFAIQKEVLSLLEEEDAPAFSRSDLYFKALSALPTAAESVITPPTTTAPLPLVTPPTPAGRTGLSRARSRSNPQLQSTSAPSPITMSSPPAATARPPSPGFLVSPTAARKDTAPPQVTFHAAFDRARSQDLFEATTSSFEPMRKVSSGSLETIASASTYPSAQRKSNAMTDSLDFLISPQTVETERSPLFGSESTPDDTVTPPSDDEFVQVQTIEAIQEALNSILASDARTQPQANQSTTSLPSLKDTSLPPPPRRTSTNASLRSSGPATPALSSSANLPSRLTTTPRSSSHNSSTAPRYAATGTVFDDTEVTDDDDGSEADLVEEPASDEFSVGLPAAGDLSLATEIPRLADSLEKLRKQEIVVDALIRKAELTGVASELKVLVKSRESLRREIRAATFQKEQLESQAAQNELSPTRTRITIPGTTVGQASAAASGATFQLYLIEVHTLTEEGAFQSGWITTRRYSEFLSLYNKLKEKFPSTRNLDFPSKRLVGAWSKEFIEQRRVGLERYLQNVIKLPAVCVSDELRSFLSKETVALPKSDGPRRVVPPLLPGQGLVRSLYRGLTTGIDDVLGTSTSSMVEQMVNRLSQQAADFAGIAAGSVLDEDLVGQVLADSVSSLADAGRPGEEGLTYFTAPICDLFVTIFELKEKNNWLRRQAILIVLQQVLGGTIERKFRDSVKLLLAPPQLASYVAALQNGMWPNGELKPKEPARTAAEKAATKASASRKLADLLPDVAASLIGRHNAKQGARRLFATLQNKRLNKHLIYSIADEIFAVVFPEIKEPRARPLFLA